MIAAQSWKDRVRVVAPFLSLAVAIGAAVASAWLLAITGGTGAIIATLAAVAIGCAWSVQPLFVIRRRRAARLAELDATEPSAWRRDRRTVWAISKAIIATLVVWNGVSAAIYVSHDNGDPLQQRLAAWGRNHGLGGIIDYMEAQMYDVPPSKDPAKDLSLVVPTIVEPTTTTTPQTDSSQPVDATTTTIDPGPQAPAPLQTYFDPPLAGEGQWAVIANAGGFPALWATSIRPFPEAGGVVASMVVIDQTHLRSGMFNGSEEPGGDWVRDDRVPTELYASLVAAMNGGFRFEHVQGGYFTEGKLLKPLKQGDATIAIDREGTMVIGELGRDIQDDGSWLSIRQNLILLVDGGVSQAAKGTAAGVWWGADYGANVYVNRSGVCELGDGRLAYLMVGPVSIDQFAQSLINVGCVKAIQLDINGTWPNFFTFEHLADGGVKPLFLDKRMGTNTYRYIKGSTKEFFAFFDATLVPDQSVLDA